MFNTQCADYDKINKNDPGATEEEGERDNYFLKGYMATLQNWVIPSNQDACQFVELLLGGPYGGYFADVRSNFNNRNFSTYIPENHWIQVLFNDYFTNVITTYNTIEEKTDDPVLLSVAKVCKVMSMARVADVYGPIPYTKAGIDGVLYAPYDTQEEVYNAFFNDLDDAIEKLTENQTNNFSTNSDRFYGGNPLKWAKLANSVKLRLAMRIVNANPTLAKAKAEEVMNHPIGPMSANSDNAVLTLTTAQNNPYDIGFVVYNGGDTRASADITSYMSGYNDPRRTEYFDLSTFSDASITNGYIGFRSGVTIPSPQSIGQQYSSINVNLRDTRNMQIMCAAEVAFLRAEGALRGWSMGGTAKDLYESGITLSFEQWGASGASAYIADNTSMPDRYTDPLVEFSYIGTPSTVKIAWDNSNTSISGPNLERIITQKWIAIYPNGIEAWTEFRRTGFPKLMPVVTNNSNGIVSNERMARRLPYPQSEYTSNLNNVQQAVSNYLGGPDNMATDLWWAKKD